MKYELILMIKLDLCLVHTLTYVTSCLKTVLKKACNTAGKKIQTSTITSEANTPLVVSLLNTPTPPTCTRFELSAKIDLSFPFGVAVNSLLSIT